MKQTGIVSPLLAEYQGKSRGKSKPFFTEMQYDTTLSCWLDMTSTEEFRGWRNVILVMKWDPKLVSFEGNFRPGKSLKRIEKYMIPGELERFKKRVAEGKDGVIRFGNKKERGEFCLIGGCYSGGTFYLYYRSLEITLEWVFDLVLLSKIARESGIKIRRLVVIAPKVFASTRAGRRQYYNKLRKILGV